ncbi:hypothetical protein MRS44_018133 [Fusarium solani]|uniref:uncharacterized protein n=1 Tax=Fusarium solani TaxID=169388 RepID=UPI0032C459A5|nr:hypothetical protein MRS44_018133 [Fusarium solani]
MSVNGSIISSPKPEPASDIVQHPSGAHSFPTATVTSDDDSDVVPNSAGPAPPAKALSTKTLDQLQSQPTVEL